MRILTSLRQWLADRRVRRDLRNVEWIKARLAARCDVHLPDDVTPDEIRRAWRRLAARHWPDWREIEPERSARLLDDEIRRARRWRE